MKLFLTSAGLSNQTINHTLTKLIGESRESEIWFWVCYIIIFKKFPSVKETFGKIFPSEKERLGKIDLLPQ